MGPALLSSKTCFAGNIMQLCIEQSSQSAMAFNLLPIC